MGASGFLQRALETRDPLAPLLRAFLDHRVKDRGNGARSRNVHLAAIHSTAPVIANLHRYLLQKSCRSSGAPLLWSALRSKRSLRFQRCFAAITPALDLPYGATEPAW
jgi:hypothetical protein